MRTASPLPWHVLFGEAPPPELRGYQGSVVQAPRGSALEALQAMRQHGAGVGALLVCLVHELAHVPIAPEDGPWQWPPPSALCRRRITRCSSGDGSALDYRPCTARFWLRPPETPGVLTDGHAFYDTLCRVRSLRRRSPQAQFPRPAPVPLPTPGIPYEDVSPQESPHGPHPSHGPDPQHHQHHPQDVDDLYHRWTS
ncbi:hypothetical protein JJV70_07765 [Streptomyces sp. JJ66]|uniref:hypothetical protein n=1 Tax=Streptomyces sp. JJ66 TaxID=2803843 RepID=UPI001C59C8D1|nr:hypothetical protein [Streptomyces sp. JJ66]MBW1602011.1 hypothetical protein [Streptomyces sp. JJ66]